MDSAQFFRQASAGQFTGSMDYLDSQQAHFHRDQTSGMIKIQLNPAECIILLYARGNSAGTYHLSGATFQPIFLSEIHTFWTGSDAPFTTLVLPDVAGRLIWLRLESHLQSQSQVRNAVEWEAWINSWKAEMQNGLVQIASEHFDGLVYIQAGEIVKSESIFSTERGFQSNLPFSQFKQAFPCELTFFTPPLNSHANQTFILRRGVSDWTHLILDRYREMVGKKLLQIMIARSNLSIKPWQWQVQLEGTALWDQHFFPNLEAAVQAYRSLLMSVGEQSSLMIGNGLSQRLVTETYDQLIQAEKDSLEKHRLIPAALA
jgi:hypothetical protein